MTESMVLQLRVEVDARRVVQPLAKLVFPSQIQFKNPPAEARTVSDR